jgi:surface antigen
VRVLAPIFGMCALALTTLTPAPAQAQYWQCVGYARQISGVEIRGNAHTWWNQADGRYARGKAPREGAVMAFKSHRGMPLGHVAVVSRIVSDREILLNHANWSRGGRVEHGVRAVDVSDAGDWSAVKVWYGPIGGIGTRVNPVAGFIYPDQVEVPAPRPQYTRGPLIGQDVIQLAMLEQTASR